MKKSFSLVTGAIKRMSTTALAASALIVAAVSVPASSQQAQTAQDGAIDASSVDEVDFLAIALRYIGRERILDHIEIRADLSAFEEKRRRQQLMEMATEAAAQPPWNTPPYRFVFQERTFKLSEYSFQDKSFYICNDFHTWESSFPSARYQFYLVLKFHEAFEPGGVCGAERSAGVPLFFESDESAEAFYKAHKADKLRLTTFCRVYSAYPFTYHTYNRVHIDCVATDMTVELEGKEIRTITLEQDGSVSRTRSPVE